MQFRTGVATQRARAGVTARPSMGECVSKYGSLREARRVVRCAPGPCGLAQGGAPPLRDAYVVAAG